ncbi:DUF1998 domain-containing protein [Stomatohabitans albus]|uniref:DUF1998 domain-containing protein n=1 Tax=Stomatohabitans albus TaxID=3110766 RepID=UPI00300C06B5
MADIDPAAVLTQWAEHHTGLALAHHRAVTIRWINAGKASQGATLTMGGQERAVKRFRVCEGCGKLDRETGQNNPHEHRAWCAFRNTHEEQNRTIVLTHTLQTQGLVVYLPRHITLADDFAIPSLAAAVRLGLREHLGGEPDHLDIALVRAPLPNQQGTADALLIHDLVPGGTGYLSEWETSKNLHRLLATAWEVVANCPCKDEERLACHRCLLPFAGVGRQVGRVSRATAERHLATLLCLDGDEPDKVPDFRLWKTESRIDTAHYLDRESALEHDFRKLLLDRFTTAGATIKETPKPTGNVAAITLPGSPRRWTLSPQVHVLGTVPDFLLVTDDRNVPDVAIYTDGWQFHASPTHNRLGDDAQKRTRLREAGYVVLGVTYDDLANAESGKALQPYLDDAAKAKAIGLPTTQSSPKAYDRLSANPLDWLVEWLVEPDVNALTTASRAMMFAFSPARPSSPMEEPKLRAIPQPVGVGESLAGLVARELSGGQLPPSSVDRNRKAALWRSGSLGVGIEQLQDTFEIAVVLDDRQASLADGRESWQAWLRYANAMALRDWPTTITTLSLVDASLATPKAPVETFEDTVVELDGAWADLYDLANEGAEQAVLTQLASAGVGAVPVIGEEGPGGIMLDISWPEAKVAVEIEPMEEADRADLLDAGWQIVPVDASTLITDLAAAGVK